MSLQALDLRSCLVGGGGVGYTWGWKKEEGAVVRQAPCWRKSFEEDIIKISTRYGGRRDSWYRSLEVRASGKKKMKDDDDSSYDGSDDPEIPEEEIPEDDGSDGSNSPSDKNEFEEATHKSHGTSTDWRTFRANFVFREQVLLDDSNALTIDSASQEPSPKRLGPKWAHLIPMPVSGCVLVATDKLDGLLHYERAVVLLLTLHANNTRGGVFGVIINRPLHRKIKHMRIHNPELATTFADCPLHFGGPLHSQMFLLVASERSSLVSFEQVIPGIFFGNHNSLTEAAGVVEKGVCTPQDFRFFIGSAGWQLDQLKEEIESEYWVVAACSSDLIFSALPGRLWEEILQLMGDQYRS